MKLLWTFIFLASQYSPGMMELVIQNRIAEGHLSTPLPKTDGFIATRDCEHIGKVIWLAPLGYEGWESFLVVDCARPRNTDGAWEWMTKHNIQVEVDYFTAVRWDTVGRGIKVRLKTNGPRLLE